MFASAMLVLIATLTLCQLTAAAPAAAKVAGLPGWTGPMPSDWYSGFVSVGATKKLHVRLVLPIIKPVATQSQSVHDGAHMDGGIFAAALLQYVFVEAESDPMSRPVLLWLNGGPGCSSMDGLMYEHGPLLVNHNGTELVRNPHSWSTVANVLYLEAPAGVGFSYPPPTGSFGANQTAVDNTEALIAWFADFPEYKVNDFYISGESYGGIYVPTLSQKVYESNHFPQFKGFLVGNGAWGGDCSGSDASLEFLHGHGAVSDRLYAQVKATCAKSPTGLQCEKLMEQAESMSEGLNGYDFYRDCYGQEAAAHPTVDLAKLRNGDFSSELIKVVKGPRPAHPAVARAAREKSGTGMQVPCIDSDGADHWLNNPAVKEALHVESSPMTWSICSEAINMHWNRREFSQGMPPIYKSLMPHLDIMVYNGDVDPSCSYVANQRCIDGLGAPVSEAWRPWQYTDPHVYDGPPGTEESGGVQTGGWVAKYSSGAHHLTFLTVKGAGHMSPQWKPLATITWLTRWLNHTTI